MFAKLSRYRNNICLFFEKNIDIFKNQIICNNQEQFDEANNYLMTFRQSPKAWSISIQLLNEKEDQYVFQGLSILEEYAHFFRNLSESRKIQLDFHTLSPELANSLGDILLGKCSEFLGRICLYWLIYILFQEHIQYALFCPIVQHCSLFNIKIFRASTALISCIIHPMCFTIFIPYGT